MQFKWLFNLSSVGVNLESENDIGRRILFSNIVFLTLPLVYTIFMVFDYKSYFQSIHTLQFDQFIVPIVIGVCAFCLWLNKIKQTSLSRIIFLLAWPTLLHIIPIKLLQTPPDYYLAFPIGIIFHSVLIQLMLSPSDEKLIFWFFMGLNLMVLFFSLNILLLFDTDFDIPTQITNNKYFLLDSILYWLLFNLVAFYMILSIGKHIDKINSSRILIEQQKEELKVLNKNLEIVVTERTKKLEAQNTKLRDHAFYNAHLLRGPFCRVQGLIQLQEIVTDEQEKLVIQQKLEFSVSELEERIREIQEIVDEEKPGVA